MESESEEEAGRALEAKVAEEEHQQEEDGAPANKNRWGGGGVLEALGTARWLARESG